MIRRKCLSSFGTSALAISLLSATSVCAVGQTVATPYLVASSEVLSKPAGPMTFLAAPAFRVTGTPSSAIATDLNGDGKPDLVVASALSGEITVYLGTGQGNFSNPAVYSVGGHPVAIASADLRGSGRQDIVAANGADGTVSVLLGLGDGKLGPARVYSAGMSADILALGSLRGDGKQDVAIATTGGKKLAVMLNDGYGALAGAISQPLARTPTSLTIAHFRGSDQTDLALANDDGTVSILLGHGDGNFNPPVLLNVSASRLSLIVAGDFDHDGKADLAVAQPEGHLLTLLRGNGDGTFVPGPSYSVGNDPVYASSLDVNGDGISDLITVNHGNNTFSVLLGNGDGSFKTAVHSTVGDGPVALASGDFYGRGFTGLAVVNAAAKTVSIVDGNGDGSFRAAPSYSGDLSPRSIVAGDLNGDGKSDLVVTNFCGTDAACSKGGTISVYLAKSTGGYSLTSKYPVGAGPVSALLSDLNGDKVLDAVLLNRTAKTVSVLLGVGDGTFAEPRTLPLADAPATFAIGDFNKDGKADLAIATDCGSEKCSQPGSLQILFGAGNGSFSAGHTYTLGYSPSSIAVGDLRQTGSLDILIANRCGSDSTCASTGTATVLSGDGKGNFTPKTDLSIGNTPSSIALGSLSGTKVLDLVVSRESDNAVSVLRGNGDGTFALPASYAVGGAPRSVVIGNFAGTGKTDVAVSNFNDSTVSVLFGNGDSTLQSAIAYSVGAGPQSLAVVTGKTGTASSLITANGNSGTSEPGSGITELANVHPDTGSSPIATTLALTGNSPASAPLPYASLAPVNTFTASVTPATVATPGPTGTVTLIDTTNSNLSVCTISTLALDSTKTDGTFTGTCTPTTPLSAGAHTISGTYAPSDPTAYAAPASPTTLNQKINQLDVAVSGVTPANSSLTYGQPIAFNATVTGADPSSATIVGTVGFSTTPVSTFTCNETASGQPAGVVMVSHGIATCTLSGGPIPNIYRLAASYSPLPANGNFTNHVGQQNNQTGLTVSPAPTMVTLTPPSTSLAVNQSATFTAVAANATTTPPGTIPPSGGTMTFTVTTTPSSGTPQTTPIPGVLTPGTTAKYTASAGPLALGAVTVTAAYTDGNTSTSNFADSSSAPLTILIGKGTSSVSVTRASAPVVINGSATFVATVGPAPVTGKSSPTGKVTFSVGTAPVACVGQGTDGTISGGTATCTVSPLPLSVGTYAVSATYAGDDNFGQSSGSVTAGVTVTAGATSVKLVPATPTSVINQSVSFTATVQQTPTAGPILPTGKISFAPISECSGSNAVPVDPSTGSATCTTGSLPVGSDSITATYNDTLGTPNFSPSTSGASTQTVNKGDSTIAVISSKSTSVVNDQVVFTANVTQTPISTGKLTGSAVPGGTVSFTFTRLGSAATVAGCTASVNLVSGAASCTTTQSLIVGTYTVMASYGGDGSFHSANPNATTNQTVTPDPIVITVAPGTPTIVATQTAVFTATLTPSVTGPVLPHGKVTFVVTGGDGSTPACVSTPPPGLVQPTAAGTSYSTSCSIQFPTGSDTPFIVTASYLEDQTANFTANAAGTANLTVGDFVIVPPSTSATNKGVVDVTPGFTVGISTTGTPPTNVPPTDPFFTSAVTTHLTSIGLYKGAVGYTCAVAPASGQPSSLKCAIGPVATDADLDSFNISISASDTAVVAGIYPVTLTGIDQTPGSTLSRSVAFTVTVVPQTTAPPIVLTATEPVTASFTIDSPSVPSDTFTFACSSTAYDTTTSSSVSVATVGPNGVISNGVIYCNPNTASGPLPTSGVSFQVGNPQSATPAQSRLSVPFPGLGITTVAVVGFPLFALVGLRGRKRSNRERIVRLLGLSLLIVGLSQAIGCGSNGFIGQPSAQPTSNTPAGTYLIQVSATDTKTNQTYYSTVILPLGVQ